ncbi:Non-specific serine/threonine protein kinase [Quillaja saponaria]|uniref:non-specific serine/threonine protein kinase n=1 Tax=Quillaja saponaria TaxID=32244 RepID=A0AAD7LDK3_QUISA|nr:Non-specific serine/threonine protein kinase [Quillaja saponaria]
MVNKKLGKKEKQREGMRLGKYELGRTLGEGNFGKVKLANNIESGQPFAVKIIEKSKIVNLNVTDQIKREIATLKLLKHPNVVRLYEVLASKTRIYMVLEYVNGGELFDRIASKGKLTEAEGRKLFQQLIDGVSYCHNKGVFHRDLKLENVLVDDKGNIMISDFGLSALPQHLRNDGLLHTTCGSPHYVAPEILANRGNLAVLYQKISKGDVQLPKWLPPGPKNLIKRILDPDPSKRITMAGIKADAWFNQDYAPANPEDEEENINIDDKALSMHEVPSEDDQRSPQSPSLINAFQLIGMSSCLDLSGFFEKEDVSERKIRFTSNHSANNLIRKIEDTVTEMGFEVQKKNGRLKVMQENKAQKNLGSLSVAAEVFEISPSLFVVELRKSYGDSSVYRKLCKKLANDLGVPSSQSLVTSEVSDNSCLLDQTPP